MTRIEKTATVNVPIRTVYNQWTQFEDFPHFMANVEQVRQLSDERVEWTVRIGGMARSWVARIIEQTPDRRIAFAAEAGTKISGTVDFVELGPSLTRVVVVIDFEPEGIAENLGSWLKLGEGAVTESLRRFKELIQSERYATGEWRGDIQMGQVSRDESGRA